MMRVVRHLEAWDADACVAAVGNFDGVHRAHLGLLRALATEARALGVPAVALSFEPHPSRILKPQAAPLLITPGDAKLHLLDAAGLDVLLLLPFTRDLSLLTPREFVTRFLVEGLRVRALHEGDNFRFGHRQQGTMTTLARLGREFGFAVRSHPVLRYRGETVSSSRIRALIAAGDVARARWLLGRPPAVTGFVAPGRGIGRRRTVPTLNLQHYDELLPANGVYVTRVDFAGFVLDAVTNVGVRPTFGDATPVTVESHILQPPPVVLDAALGQPMTVHFLHRIRDERRFDSAEALRAQIHSDVAHAQRFFQLLQRAR